MEHVTDENAKIMEHVTAQVNSVRDADIRSKKKDIEQLAQYLKKSVSDEEKDNSSSELWDQCIAQEENEAIHGLLALVEYGSLDKRIRAASKLSRLAETQKHLEVIIDKGGVESLVKLACGSPSEIEQIEATLGVLYRSLKRDLVDDHLFVQIVQPLLLVLSTSTLPEKRKMVAGALYELSRSESGKEEIAKHNGISALMTAFCDHTSKIDQQTKTYAGEAIKNLSGTRTYQREVVKDISKLVKLLVPAVQRDSAREVQRDSALVILKNLSENFRAEIVNAGGIQSLQKLLPEGYDTETGQAKQYAVWTLELLSSLDGGLSSNDYALGQLLAEYQEQYIKGDSPQRAASNSYIRYRSVTQIRRHHRERRSQQAREARKNH